MLILFLIGSVLRTLLKKNLIFVNHCTFLHDSTYPCAYSKIRYESIEFSQHVRH